MTIYLYIRTSEFEGAVVSRQSSAESSDPLGAERQALNQYCEVRGWDAAETVTDYGVTWIADLAARAGGSRLLESLQSGDAVVVYTLERLFSSCYDAATTLERLKTAGVALHVVALGGDATDSAMQFDILSAARLFATLEQRRSVERIKNIKKDQRGKGRFLGGSRPFGYMIHSNGRLIENPMEQKVLKKIMQLREQGLSLRSIAAEVSTPVAPVSFKTVQRILQRNV
ncbi:MAG: recombinase family protein [Pseudomonadota bacterium]